MDRGEDRNDTEMVCCKDKLSRFYFGYNAYLLSPILHVFLVMAYA